MDRNEIIRMAREAEDKVIVNQDLDWKQEFAALVAAAERDRMCQQFNIQKELAHEKAKSNETD